MKFSLYKSIAVCSLLALAGCHDFEEMNTNPYAEVYEPEGTIGGTAESIDIDYTLTESALKSLKSSESALGATFANFVYEGLYNDYQTATNLTHDVYAGYSGSNGFLNNAPAYSYNDGWSASRWRHFYDDRTLSEYSQLIKIAWFCDKEYYHDVFYITRIYYAFLMAAQTDTYGDIPIQYYVKGAVPPEENVTYTTQEEVYGIIFKILDQAIEALQEPTAERRAAMFKLNSSQDLCYGGDVDKWLRFANSLRLRLALRVSNVDPDLAREQGVKALQNKAGLMSSQADNMKLVPKRQYISGGNENIFGLMYSWGANVVMPKELEWAYKNQALNRGVTENTDGFEEKVSANTRLADLKSGENEGEVIVNYVTDASEGRTVAGEDSRKFNESSANCILDPRCEVLWFRPTALDDLNRADRDGGVNESSNDFAGYRNGVTGVGARYTRVYSPMRCNLRSDEMRDDIWWNLAREIVWFGYSESLFLKAEAALRGWNGGTTADAKSLYRQGVEASMQYYNIPASKYQEYINNLQGLSAFDGADKESMLEQIITQKWLAVYPNGNEGWAEVRRTDYPRYLLLPRYGNNSNGEVENTKLIKRVSYPNSESRNPNKPAYTQGSRVWWDVADTMDSEGKWQTPNNFR